MSVNLNLTQSYQRNPLLTEREELAACTIQPLVRVQRASSLFPPIKEQVLYIVVSDALGVRIYVNSVIQICSLIILSSGHGKNAYYTN